MFGGGNRLVEIAWKVMKIGGYDGTGWTGPAYNMADWNARRWEESAGGTGKRLESEVAQRQASVYPFLTPPSPIVRRPPPALTVSPSPTIQMIYDSCPNRPFPGTRHLFSREDTGGTDPPKWELINFGEKIRKSPHFAPVNQLRNVGFISAAVFGYDFRPQIYSDPARHRRHMDQKCFFLADLVTHILGSPAAPVRTCPGVPFRHQKNVVTYPHRQSPGNAQH